MPGDLDLQRERAARNQGLFREVNDQIDKLNGKLGAEGTVPSGSLYLCECLDTNCTEAIHLTHDEYRRVRRDPTEFIVIPGHLDDQVEEIVETRPGWLVVRKLGTGAAVAEELVAPD